MSLLLKKYIDRLVFETYDQKPDFPVSHVKQTHSKIVVLSDRLLQKECEADGMISPLPLEHPLAIVTADCLPIVLIGDDNVAFLHAGWRGLRDGIIHDEKIQTMNPTKAFIGPHIKKCCFEVQEDFRTHMPDEKYYEYRNNKLYFDLSSYAVDQLSKFQTMDDIEVEKACTCCTNEFKSFRRNGTMDRNWNILKNR